MKDKKDIIIIKAFQKALDESSRNQTNYGRIKIVNFCNRSIKSCLQNNDIEMNSKHNEGKSVVAERFKFTMCILINYMT